MLSRKVLLRNRGRQLVQQWLTQTQLDNDHYKWRRWWWLTNDSYTHSRDVNTVASWRKIWNCVIALIFGRPFVKRFALCYRTVVCLGTQLPSPKGHSPQFSVPVCCGQTAGWIKMPLGREVGLGPGDIVLDGNPVRLLQKGHSRPHTFQPMSLWPNSSMDQDATWYRGRPWPRPHCVRWKPSSPPPNKGGTAQIFGPCLLWPNGLMDQNATLYGDRLGPCDIVFDGKPVPLKRDTAPTYRPISIVAKLLDGSRCHLTRR